MTDFPIVTALFAGMIILLQQSLMLAVGLHRVSTRVGIGTSGDATLFRKQRRHANLAENSSVLILIVALLEIFGAGTFVVLGFAGLFLIGRICHAIGFSFESGAKANKACIPGALRTIGAAATSFGGIAGALTLLIIAGISL